MEKMKIIGVIPARYASSRFPGKPLADIHGKPMIWWVYQQAKKVKELDEIYVATDDERIAAVCREHDMPFIMTSDKHSTGTDRVAEVAEKIDGDVFVNVQGDEPLIEPEALSVLCRTMREGVSFSSLCNKITDADEIASPNTVKVVIGVDGAAMYMSRSVIPSGLKGSKGDIYRHIGIYAYNREILRQFAALPQSSLELAEGIEPLRLVERGVKLKMIETKYSSVGVDTPEDLEKAKSLLPPPPAGYRSSAWLKYSSGFSSFSQRRA